MTVSGLPRGHAEPGEGGTAEAAVSEAVARDVQGLFGRDSLYVVLWGVQLVAAAALTPALTRLLGTGEFGSVATATAVMQVLFILAGMGLQTALQRQFARPGGRQDAARLLSLGVVLALVVTAVADVSGPAWSNLVGFDGYSSTLRLAVLWAGAGAATSTALGLLRSQDRLLAFSSVSLLQSVVAEAASLALVAAVRPTSTMFVLGRLLAQTAALLLALALARPAGIRLRHAPMFGQALLYALPLVPTMLSSFVLGASDRLVLNGELGAVAAGRYQIAYNIGSMPILLLSVLHSSWLPRIFSVPRPHRAAVLDASRRTLDRLLVPVVLGLAIGSPLVLRLWAPARYDPDSLLLVTAVVVVSAVPYTAGLAVTRELLAEDRTTWVAVAGCLAAGLNLGLNLVLVRHAGLLGSAVATYLAYAAQHALLLVPGRRAAVARRRTGSTGDHRARLATWASVALALLAAELPAVGAALATRVLLGVGCLAWFVVLLRRAAQRL